MELKRKRNHRLDRPVTCYRLFSGRICTLLRPFLARFDTDRSTFLQRVCAAGSAVRSCVPLFVMMTGVFAFPSAAV